MCLSSNGKAWTEGDILLLKEYIEGKYSMSDLCKLIKKTKLAIKNKLKQIKIYDPSLKNKRSTSITSFLSDEANINKELTDMIVSADTRKLFIWENITDVFESISNNSYDWLVSNKSKMIAISIADDVEMAKIQLIDEIGLTGLLYGSTDSFIEQLNTTKYKELELQNLSLLSTFDV